MLARQPPAPPGVDLFTRRILAQTPKTPGGAGG